jgi:hypothetical protein
VAKPTKTHAKRRVAVGAGTIEQLRARRVAQAKDALACGTTLADTSADPATIAAEASAEQVPASAEAERPVAEVLTKRAQAERAYAELSATGGSVSAGQLAAAAGLSASYARALVAEFQTRPPAAAEQNGRRPAAVATDADPGARP